MQQTGRNCGKAAEDITVSIKNKERWRIDGRGREKSCPAKAKLQNPQDKGTQGKDRKSLQIHIQRPLGRVQMGRVLSILDTAGNRERTNENFRTRITIPKWNVCYSMPRRIKDEQDF